uniref:Defensin 1 n=1 Tax=Avena sativa TaxID=4498 RepID=A0A223FQC9_AVESA|nr:defensin 1 [Avena sativa]AST11413.1 defensin 1 [Avena sativa]
MEFKAKATVCVALLMLLLLSSYDSGSMVEARVCTGKSQHHSFPCMSDRLCSHTCTKEQGGGWTAGYCHLRFCTCQKQC